jgi:3-oxoacyl-[acyl-carrier-protein] synthase II
LSEKRVVITGLGTVNPIGSNVPDYEAALKLGKCGITKITKFDVSDYTTKIAATLKDDVDLSLHFDKKELRRYSRFVMLAVVAATEAVKDSGLDVEKEADQIGVEIGSGIGGIEILEQTCKTLAESGPSRVGPFTVPMMIPDMAAGLVSIRTGAKGPNSASVTACASGTHSMGNAYRIIQRGDAVAMIAGGSEACVTPVGLASFCAARSLSQNEDPLTACRPFDGARDGFVMGEGAGVLVFEEYEHAKARGATIYAEVIGFGSSGDSYHITAPAPEGEGGSRAFAKALKDAGINPSDIDYINAHGTSTILNDKNETAAIKKIMGDDAYKVAISSTKSMTGHLLGAAGAIEIVAGCLAIRDSFVPPTINYNTVDPDCDLNYTPNEAVDKNIDVMVSNSFGFGGHNAVIAIKKV